MASYSAINNNNGYSQYQAGAGAGSPYNQPAYNDSGYIAPITTRKKKVSPWLKFGLPAAVIIIAAVTIPIWVAAAAYRLCCQKDETLQA